ncbi:MAG: N-formylglutamate deformylase [Candidatus Eremiobacteraeota bacterium]|nr:N-formylglutamate deformylase [Candidatus Eremiobacteraeota bacterium]MBC5803580.1 N-formylglutamate deformylase [Candidatus Eremiobacteraeota bacterium]MBC5822659.1 N-formylglutamate deformylase [Candidatus Eremiobacteraeota bacterium]
MSDAVYELHCGDGPLIVSAPHVGRELPDELAARLTPPGRALVDTDWDVDRLYPFAHDLGATTLFARCSRYVVDLNRDPSDAALYPGTRTTTLVPTETFEGEALYADGDEPNAEEVAARRERYWEPYHAALREQIARVKARHGYALLIDAHSIWGRLPLLFDGELPDVNLGTNGGRSCARALRDIVANVFGGSPYRHVVDARFKGGYITRAYGEPPAGVHALQIELNQRTYLVDDDGVRKPLVKYPGIERRTTSVPRRNGHGWDSDKAARLSVTLRAACQSMLRSAARHLPATTTPAQQVPPSQ